ncbi:MAG: hypothetical protein V3V72_13720 [Ignavibacteriaceae bacterium]
MAYVEVHYGQWDDDGGTEHQIKLLQEGGSGPSVRIALLAPTPCTIRRRGGKKIQLENHIYGSELKFNFFVHDDDIATFDAIFESEYKEWKIEHYYDSVLDWVGWLLPENHSRGWIKKGDHYPISLSATDGLAKLKEIEFVNFSTGAQYTDRVSIMTTLKRALEHVGHDLDFRVQLGTNCTNDTLMADTDCALDKVTVDSGRYAKEKDGRQVNEDCYTLIEKTLKDFNCYLIQEDGLYWIVNPQEKDSFYFTIQWATITTVDSRTAQDLAVSLSGYKYNGYGEKQKIRPFELVEATFRDRNVQDSLLDNGDFAVANTDEWTNGGDFGYFSADAYAENNELVTQVRVDIDGVPSATPNFYSDAQSISVRGESDQIQIKFKLRCTDIDMDVGFGGPSHLERTVVTCRLRKGSPTGAILTAGIPITLGQSDSTYTEYVLLFNLSETDDYHIEFLVDSEVVTESWADFDLIEVRFDDISITALYTDGPDITFDAFYKITNTDSDFIDKFEHEMFFGDSVQDNDIGSFQISGTRTETWDRFGKTEDTSIQILSAQNIIENFGQYKDYLRFQILDPDHSIKAYNLLNTDSKDYQILSHTIVFAKSEKKHIKTEVAEVLNAAVGTSVTQQLLTTIDGKISSASTVINYSPVSIPSKQDLQSVTNEGSTTTLSKNVSFSLIGNKTFLQNVLDDSVNYEYGFLSLQKGKLWLLSNYSSDIGQSDGYYGEITLNSSSSDGSVILTARDISGALSKIITIDKTSIKINSNNAASTSTVEFDGEFIEIRGTGNFKGGRYDADYSANWGAIDASNLYIPHVGWIVSNFTGAGALEDLTDVTITSIASGEVLKWNGSAWVNNTLLEALIEAALGNPGTNGYILSSLTNGTRSWVPPSATTLAALTDTNISSLASGDVFKYDGANWINVTIPNSGLEASLGNPGTDDFLLSSKADGTRSWVGPHSTLTKIVDIDDWNMDGTSSITVAHGVTLAKIRKVYALIRNDANDTYYPLDTVAVGASASAGGVISMNASNITIGRTTSGLFDSTDFNATSYNRGWVTIEYIP